MSPGSARLFVAVELPAAATAAIAGLCRGLPGARWSNLGQLHLTLRFWEALPEAELPALIDRLAGVTVPPFALGLFGVGVFPSGRRPPRVLWAGVAPEGPLAALKAAIDDAVGRDEEAAARGGFRPHLTLARFREPPGAALPPYLAAHAAFALPPWSVDGFVLYRSHLAGGGARHEALRRYPLPCP